MFETQAEQLTQVPQINPATVQSLKGGVYMNIIGGAFSQCALLRTLALICCGFRMMCSRFGHGRACKLALTVQDVFKR